MLTYFSPLSWMRWIGQFVYHWLLSMPWRETPKAIPALLVLITLAAGLIAARSGLAGWRSQLVDRQFIASWQAYDFATAELLVRRQLSQRPDDAELVFKLALVRDHREEPAEAAELMRQLVSAKQHAGAARWILEREYLNQKWEAFNETQRSEFGELLALVHRDAPKDLQVKQLYAEYSIARGNLPLAVTLLEQLASIQPMRGLQAAALSRQLGNEQSAVRLATRALEQVEKLAQEDPTNTTLWLAVAQNQLFLHRHADAVRTLRDAMPRAKSPEQATQLRQAIGEAIVAWIAFVEKSPRNTPEDRLRVLKMLQAALQYAPNNPRVLTLVADEVLRGSGDDEAVQARHQALIAGTSPGIAHFIQGTSAMMRDDIDAASMHLKIAAKLLPGSSAILNNLAVALAARPDADLEQSLKISEAAIKQTPQPTPHYYETRGQILVKLERYLDAVPDLERALAVKELAPQAHKSLALCYDKLGRPDLSRQHAQAATAGSQE